MLAGVGTLKDNNVAVTAGQFVSVADINGGKLTFDPAANADGPAYARYTFQVQDNGGTAHSGVDLDQSPNTLTINVTSVNDAPAGTNGSVTTDEDTQYVFDATDFGFTDPLDSPVNSLLAVNVSMLPTVSTVMYTLSLHDALPIFSVADINGGKLTFDPAA